MNRYIVLSQVVAIFAILLFLMLESFCVATNDAQGKRVLNEKYLNVLRLMGNENYNAVIKDCKAMINEDTSFDRAYIKLVSAYKELNELNSASKYFDELLAENPGNALAFFGLGLVYESSKEQKSALLNYKKAIQISPEFIRGYSYLVGVAKELEQLDEALKYISEIIKLNNNNASAHFGLGYIYQQQMKWDEALEELNIALKLNPNLLEAYLIIANVYSSTNRYEDCLRMNKEGLALAEKNNDLEFKEKFLVSISRVYLNSNKYKQALADFQKALEIAHEIGNKRSEADQLGHVGICYSNLGDMDKSLQFYKRALILARKIEDRQGEARHLLNIGQYHYLTSNYTEALEHYKLSLKVVNEIEYESLKENILNCMGAVYCVLGDYTNALKYYNESLKINVIDGNKGGEGNCLGNIGTVYGIIDDYPNALNYFQRALRIFENTGNLKSQSSIINNIGNVYRLLGYYTKAIEYQKKALVIDEEIGHKLGIGKALVNIGNNYFSLGDYVIALEYYQMSLKSCNEISDQETVAICLSNISEYYSTMRDYPKALEYCQQTLEIDRLIGDREGENITLRNMGDIYYALDDFSKALDNYNKSLEIVRELGLKLEEANTLSHIGRVYIEEGNYYQALEIFENSLTIKTKIIGGKHPSVAMGFIDIGNVYYRLNEFNKASYYSQKSLISLSTGFNDSSIYSNPPLEKVSSDNGLLVSLKQKAKILEKLYRVSFDNLKDLQMSLSTYQLASNLIDKMRIGYKAEGSKLFLGEEASNICNGGIRTALQLYDLTKNEQYKEQAFAIAEKSKSAVLWETLSESRAKGFAGIPDSLLEKERSLRIDLTFYDTQIQKEEQKKENQDSQKIVDFKDRYFALSRQCDELISEFEKDYPKYYDLKYQTETVSIPELQKTMDENTALLEYSVGDSSLFIFILSKQDFDVVSVPVDSTFNGSVSQFCSAIKKAQPDKYQKLGSELYARLIKPIEKHIASKSNLVIIPDGQLFYLPFEALLEKYEPSEKVNFTNLDYLIKRYKISYHYSATLFTQHAKQQPGTRLAATGEFLGFAPVFSDSVNNGLILASHRSVFDTTYADSMNSLAEERGKLKELAYSEQEIREIVELFSEKKRQSFGYLHRDASEENFKSQARRYNYVHIASHSLINEMQPKLSAIVFSQPTDPSLVEDGLLYAGEIYNLNINADLVVLSSCESGIGKMVKGEGMMALTRGFLYAGAKNIVSSLWKVDDKDTKDLMIEFYRHVISGKEYSEALRETKLAMLKNEETAFPSIWSSFVLVGRGR
ncbi:tetratricopeptide repeat protein [candidate division KSB1 bacterium]|nr:tetratricopeptide repeat protein [candidate division KSB1 bacterium]